MGGRKLFWKMKDFLNQTGGMGRDQFFDLLRRNGLLVRKRRGKKPRTTFSAYWRRYPNLIEGFVLDAPNLLWVSDITYICILNHFAYLSLVTDAYSRKIVGYYLWHSLEAIGPLRALERALEGCSKLDNLIHHSDRGVQYYCADYTNNLKNNEIAISMTQNGNPGENALAERVNGILKDELLEEIYPDFNTASKAIEEAIDIYNSERTHLSIDNLTPNEAHSKSGPLKKHWKDYSKLNKQKEVIMQMT